jgi:hypothetical protein
MLLPIFFGLLSMRWTEVAACNPALPLRHETISPPQPGGFQTDSVSNPLEHAADMTRRTLSLG